jgi:hypothetical protein
MRFLGFKNFKLQLEFKFKMSRNQGLKISRILCKPEIIILVTSKP